jgi:hypothetical protein
MIRSFATVPLSSLRTVIMAFKGETFAGTANNTSRHPEGLDRENMHRHKGQGVNLKFSKGYRTFTNSKG